MIANFIDIDYTLWDNKAKWWILNKNKPNKYIIHIQNNEAELIKSGYYKKDELPIYYNGIEGFISKELFSNIQRNGKIDISDVGISAREFNDSKYITKQLNNFIKYADNLNIFNKNDDYYLITKRGNKKAHKKLLTDIQNTLDINIVDEFFISDNKLITNTGSIVQRKIFVLLQYLIGYIIKKNTIEPLISKKYEIINYYTDTLEITDYKEINNTLKELLNNCPIFLQEKIKAYLDLKDIYFNLKILTSNEINPFITEKIKIVVN